MGLRVQGLGFRVGMFLLVFTVLHRDYNKGVL